MRIKFKMMDSIVCVELKQRTNKVLVLKMNSRVEMTSINEQFLKNELEQQKNLLWTDKKKFNDLSVMDIQVEELTPYFVDMIELNDKKFKSTKKRELVTPLSCSVEMRNDISPYNPQRDKVTTEYDRRSHTNVKMNSVIIKVSMDDLYILSSIASALTKQAMEISKLWSDYAQGNQAPKNEVN